MLWLALHLPLLSLEAFCATLPEAARQRPVVLMADHRVHTLNPAAAECGIRPGIKRATALALASDLLVADSQPARDAAALLAVAHAALAFTPAVTLQDPLQDPQTVLLEVQASLRLFGGLPALQQRLAAAIAPLGHRVQWAAAPTPLGAALLARWSPADRKGRAARAGRASSGGPGEPTASDDLLQGPHTTRLDALQSLLDAAPVWLLGPGREHWEALQGMGLSTLSDLRALPRSGLARRFGEGLLDELDRALGRLPDPRRPLALPAVFDSRLELYARAENTDQVLHGAAVLLSRLVAWAQGQHARVGAFTLRMLHERHRQAVVPPTELHVELAEPALEVAHLQLLLRERLARVVLAAPTLELRLGCSHLVAGHAPNGELFPTRASEAEGLTRLLERLRARLGDAQVQRLVPVADHRPEQSSRPVPAQGDGKGRGGGMGTGRGLAAGQGGVAGGATCGPAGTASPAAWTGDASVLNGTWPLHRPAWLLPEPMPLAEREAQPLLEGRPLQLVSGPERIETGWWDGAPVVRDYFIAQVEDGSLVWVYRGRLPRQPGEVNWFLQGRFA
jgi:protein ImuB